MTPTEIALALGYDVEVNMGAPNEYWCEAVVEDYQAQEAFCDLCEEHGHVIVPVTQIRPWIHKVAWEETR